MNDEDQPRDPFADFINETLDMAGVEGLDQAAVAKKVRRILRDLPTHVTPDLWNERLDSLQAVIRVCLDLSTVLSAFEERIDSERFSHDDLETLVMLSVTFAFASYNQLKPAYNVDDAPPTDMMLLAQRLRDTLQATLGWVRRAAHEGDPVAARLSDEVSALLDASSDLE